MCKRVDNSEDILPSNPCYLIFQGPFPLSLRDFQVSIIVAALSCRLTRPCVLIRTCSGWMLLKSVSEADIVCHMCPGKPGISFIKRRSYGQSLIVRRGHACHLNWRPCRLQEKCIANHVLVILRELYNTLCSKLVTKGESFLGGVAAECGYGPGSVEVPTRVMCSFRRGTSTFLHGTGAREQRFRLT